MQEEIENKSVTLIINSSKLTARTLATAFMKFLRYSKGKLKEHHDVKPQGKQTVKELIAQNQGVEKTELADKAEVKTFDHIAKQYGVDYAIKKDKTGEIPRYLVFFKARDADALTAAFTEYTGKKAKAKEKPSVIQMLRALRAPEIAKDVTRVRNKDKGLEL